MASHISSPTADAAAMTRSVKEFGAKGDGVTDDAAAIQLAINSIPDGATLFFPAGTYQTGSEISIERSDITLMGVGVESIIRRTPHSHHNMIVIPANRPANPENRTRVIKNITITKLTFDGNKLQVSGNATQGFQQCIWIRQAENITLSDLYLHDHRYEAISAANGFLPVKNLTIRNVHIQSGRRQGFHIGYAQHVVIDQVYVEDTPAQILNEDGTPRFDNGRPVFSPGTGLDIEVEGYKPLVEDVQVTNSIFDRVPATGSSAGVSLAPAYGPIRNVTIRDNVVRNHQYAVALNGVGSRAYRGPSVDDVRIENNFLLNEQSHVQGQPVLVAGSQNVTVSGNVITDLANLWKRGIRITSGNVTVVNNTVRIRPCLVNVIGTPVVEVSNNRYSGACVVDKSGTTAATINESGNTPLATSTVETAPPQVSIGVAPGKLFSTRTTVPVTATGSGGGVARIYFFVDGIPKGYSDAASTSFPFDPTQYLTGPHTLSAMAVSRSARISAMTSVSVRVNNPTENITDSTKIITTPLPAPASRPKSRARRHHRRSRWARRITAQLNALP